MAQCIYCAADTRLYINDKPVCLDCAKDLEAGRKPSSRGENQGNQAPKQRFQTACSSA